MMGRDVFVTNQNLHFVGELWKGEDSIPVAEKCMAHLTLTSQAVFLFLRASSLQ